MLLSETHSIAIRDFWAKPLKALLPVITRLGVRPLKSGPVIAGYYVEIGTRRRLNVAEKTLLNGLLDPSGPGGGGLLGPAGIGAPGRVTVKVVVTGPMRRLSGSYTWTGDVEPIRGGHAVGSVSDPPGTLGCLVRLRRNGALDPTSIFLLTCEHVLVHADIEWPGTSIHFSKALGHRYWGRLDGNFDVALGLIDSDEASIGEGFAWSRTAGCPSKPTSPANIPDPVFLCGQISRADGVLQSTSVTLWVDYPGEPSHEFTDQIQTASMCVPGDSGAILFLEDGKQPIGMAFVNNPVDPDNPPEVQRGTYYNKLSTLFSTVVTDANYVGDSSFQVHSIIVGPGTAATTGSSKPKKHKTKRRKRRKLGPATPRPGGTRLSRR